MIDGGVRRTGIGRCGRCLGRRTHARAGRISRQDECGRASLHAICVHRRALSLDAMPTVCHMGVACPATNTRHVGWRSTLAPGLGRSQSHRCCGPCSDGSSSLARSSRSTCPAMCHLGSLCSGGIILGAAIVVCAALLKRRHGYARVAVTALGAVSCIGIWPIILVIPAVVLQFLSDSNAWFRGPDTLNPASTGR